LAGKTERKIRAVSGNDHDRKTGGVVHAWQRRRRNKQRHGQPVAERDETDRRQRMPLQ
jgi:hypothetical protein